MQDHPGLFLVLEGADGSGKTTQFNLLAENLKKAGYDVEVFDFPRYDEPSSHFVRTYLNGGYGPASSISPYTASLFYALDRYEAAPAIRKALEEGKIVLSNRYVGSNMAHQGSKFDDPIQQRGFFLWEDGLEFQLLGIPRPTLNIYLRVPADISYQLIAKKAERSYTKKSHDEHEADISHLRRSVDTYDTLTQLFPKDFVAIQCVDENQLLSIDKIAGKIWKAVEPLLPAPKKTKEINKANPTTKEIAPPPSAKQTEASLNDGNIHIRLKNVSLLAAANIDTSLAKVRRHFDFKNSFDFHLPENISDDSVAVYTDSMEKMKDTYSKMRTGLEEYFKHHPSESNQTTEQVLMPLLPLATYSNLDLYVSHDNISHLIANLGRNPLPEIRQLALKIEKIALSKGLKLTEAADAGQQEAPEQVGNTLAKLAQERLPQLLAESGNDIELMHATPRNEFELIVEGLYPHTNLSPGDIAAEMETWSYQQKEEALKTILQNADTNTLNHATYRIDASLDRPTIEKLKEGAYIEDLRMQLPTPRYGYGMPRTVEDAALEDPYLDIFDESLALFSHLQETGREEYGGYATLLGHKVRCQFTIHASQLQNAEVIDETALEVLLRIREKISEVHPLIAENLTLSLRRPAPAITKDKNKSASRNRKSSRRGGKPKKS